MNYTKAIFLIYKLKDEQFKIIDTLVHKKRYVFNFGNWIWEIIMLSTPF